MKKIVRAKIYVLQECLSGSKYGVVGLEADVSGAAEPSCHGNEGVSSMMDAAPNVVTEEGLRSLLANGYRLEVRCKEHAERRHNTWYGAWTIRAVSADGRADKMLVTSRSVLKLREFRTIVGLVSFLVDMGVDSVSLPLREGGRELQSAPALRG